MTPDEERHHARALELAFQYISHKPRTVAQVRGRLESAEIPPSIGELVIDQLVTDRYLDDGAFADAFASEKRELSHWGDERIARRLRELGVERDQITTALDVRGRAEGLSDAVALLRRRCRSAPEDDRERQRALGLLARKGYDLDLAYEAIRVFSAEAA